jgi:transcriptional antiterminator RfaH
MNVNSGVTGWYAVYTRSRNEKKVYALLKEQSIESYLPLQRRLKQWSDRRKWIEEPLIRSYIFVRASERDYYTVLNTPGVVKYVTFSGRAAPIPDRQINTLKRLLATEADLEVIPQILFPGAPIEVIAGPLMGLRGEMVQYKGKNRVVIRINEIGQSVLLTIPAAFLAAA